MKKLFGNLLLQAALSIVKKELEKDRGNPSSWFNTIKANIAMSVHEEIVIHLNKHTGAMTTPDIALISNEAAEKFLNNLLQSK